MFVLSGFWAGQEAQIISAGLIPVLASAEQLDAFRAMGRSDPFALNIDTGMNRLGFSVADTASIASMNGRPVMVMSHLA
ncbi:MAG: alanine racemase, partial [Rhizobium sp.]|nr:alanine racemase [Rhizobium sp.]